MAKIASLRWIGINNKRGYYSKFCNVFLLTGMGLLINQLCILYDGVARGNNRYNSAVEVLEKHPDDFDSIKGTY